MLDCKEFVNADEIARGISPFQPETVALQAGRIMLERVQTLLDEGVDFALETTLTTLSYLKTIEQARSKGYTVTLLYFWLENVEMAIDRVAKRVGEGGHNIPEDVIRRRYSKGIKNLINKFIHVSDIWIVVNNSLTPFTFIAKGSGLENVTVSDETVWEQMKNLKK